MRFTIDTPLLAQALRQFPRVFTKQPARPELQAIALTVTDDHQLVLRATDLILQLSVHLPVADDAEPGSCCVPGPAFSGLIAKIEASTCTWISDPATGRGQLRYGSSRTSLQSRPVDLPEFPSPGAPTAETWTAEDVERILRQLLFARGQDPAKPILQGLSWTQTAEGTSWVATDGSRLSRLHLPAAASQDIRQIVPPGLFPLLAAVMDAERPITVALSEATIALTQDTVTLISRFLDGTYPVVDRIFPDTYPTICRVPREALLRALDRLTFLSRYDVKYDSAPVGVYPEPTQLRLTMNIPETGDMEECIPAETTGAECTPSFNPGFLQAAIKALSGPTAELAFSGPQTPLRITAPDDPAFEHLLLPLRQLT